MMPLSFATLLGGLCTIVGTPANLIVSGALRGDRGLGFGFLDFAPTGFAVTVAGLAGDSALGATDAVGSDAPSRAATPAAAASSRRRPCLMVRWRPRLMTSQAGSRERSALSGATGGSCFRSATRPGSGRRRAAARGGRGRFSRRARRGRPDRRAIGWPGCRCGTGGGHHAAEHARRFPDRDDRGVLRPRRRAFLRSRPTIRASREGSTSFSSGSAISCTSRARRRRSTRRWRTRG